MSSCDSFVLTVLGETVVIRFGNGKGQLTPDAPDWQPQGRSAAVGHAPELGRMHEAASEYRSSGDPAHLERLERLIGSHSETVLNTQGARDHLDDLSLLALIQEASAARKRGLQQDGTLI